MIIPPAALKPKAAADRLGVSAAVVIHICISVIPPSVSLYISISMHISSYFCIKEAARSHP